MNYELAKKLKDAGFKCKGDKVVMSDTLEKLFLHGAMVSENGVCEVPTLSELIEACHPRRADELGLITDSDRWEAFYIYNGYFEHNAKFHDDEGFCQVDVKTYGQTPEEAVANLWLALQDAA